MAANEVWPSDTRMNRNPSQTATISITFENVGHKRMDCQRAPGCRSESAGDLGLRIAVASGTQRENPKRVRRQLLDRFAGSSSAMR